MKSTQFYKLLTIFILSLFLWHCKESSKKSNKLQVVTTTTIITDLVKQIGGNLISVQGLMGSGVDPHLYKASEGDVNKLVNANIIFYNGLHLEGKFVEIFEKMASKSKTSMALGEVLDEKDLLASSNFASNYDPHVWFNIAYYKQFAYKVAHELSKALPEHKITFNKNTQTYISQLNQLENEVTHLINTLPPERRILVTAHDAFNYFGAAYNFKVIGLQGLSTATEAGVKDVQQLANFIIDNKVKAIFVETSVPKRTIEALQAAVNSKGHQVKIGGALYSDALGTPNTLEGTYIGMFKYNVKTMVEALQ